MPESNKTPKKTKRSTKPVADQFATKAEDLPNPVWFKPLMFGFMLLGLVWIITYYVTSAQFPIGALENWNILIGFGIAMVGFMMSTRWK